MEIDVDEGKQWGIDVGIIGTLLSWVYCLCLELNDYFQLYLE